MKHVLIPITVAATVIGLLVATGKGEFSASTFTYDARDDRPANAQQQKAP